MTTYVLAGSQRIANQECHNQDLYYSMYTPIILTPSRMYALEGRNILKGDKVLFGYGTTVEMINRFMAQCQSRGTQLSDLEIIHGPN